MRFVGKCKKGVVLTDNYNFDEVLRGVHIQHFKEDLRRYHVSSMEIYDEDMHFITKLTR